MTRIVFLLLCGSSLAAFDGATIGLALDRHLAAGFFGLPG